MNAFVRLRAFACAVNDPRVERTKLHNLADMIVIAIYALVCQACGWLDIATTAKDRINEIKIPLPNGIPSHDTFGRVFRRINPDELQTAISGWFEGEWRILHGEELSFKGETVAMDGKTLRHSFDTASGLSPLHSISVFATEHMTVLRQIFGRTKDSEITQDVELLKQVDLEGAVVTADAIACQKKTVQQIIEGNGADYVVACKDNQPALFARMLEYFEDADKHPERYAMDSHSTTDSGGHGRIECRSCTCIDVSMLDDEVFSAWTGIRTIARISDIRDDASGRKSPVRYFICSLPCDAREIMRRIRQHWLIENSLHHVLDVTCGEDACRIRKGYGPHNFAIMLRASLARIRNNMSSAGEPDIATVRQARLKAMRNPEYAHRLFTGEHN